MRVTVDRDVCAGHGRCNALGPDVYELDDVGYCDIGSVEVPPELEDQAVEGAQACPELAITIS